LDSRSERERLKEEYKAHYRQILETRKQIEDYKRKQRIVDALDKMNAGGILESMENMLHKIREKVAMAEARIEVASDQQEKVLSPEDEALIEKHRARETLQQIKLEMGLLQDEIDDQVKQLQADKTVGRDDKADTTGTPETPDHQMKSVRKTIGPQKSE
jgi:phage shock protein A